MRQPLQVIVFPFRVTAAGLEYAIFRRADDGCWQGRGGRRGGGRGPGHSREQEDRGGGRPRRRQPAIQA